MDEPYSEQLVVEIALKIDHEHFDSQGVSAKGGTVADAEGALVGLPIHLYESRVDAGCRNQLAGGEPQVGGRKAELAPSLGAVLNRRAKEVVVPKQLSGGSHLPQEEQPPNAGAADRCLAPRQR